MAVYEHTYKPYEGKLTPAWSRFLVLPRYAYQDLFKYKLFTALFVLCYVCPLIYTVLIYLRHNVGALAAFGTNALEIAREIPIGGGFFFIFINIQTSLAFLFTVILTLLATAFSAWIKWRTAASAALFAIFIIPTPIGFIIGEMFDTNKGHMLNLAMAFNGLSKQLFRLDWMDSFLSAGESWFVFAAYAALCLLMLSRRVRAYEVVS